MRLVGAPPMAATSAMVDRQQIVDLAPLQRVELEGWPLTYPAAIAGSAVSRARGSLRSGAVVSASHTGGARGLGVCVANQNSAVVVSSKSPLPKRHAAVDPQYPLRISSLSHS
jgi:hypothetical protein